VHRHIPIVMMSSLPSPVSQPGSLYDAVLRKPFTPDQLLRTMRASLATRPGTNGDQSS
jgi:hypothetical protein